MSSRRDRLLFGFAEHALTSTFLASSTGLRRRFDQPTGRVELNAKSADYRRSAWNGVHTRDFTDVDVGALADGLNTRLDWAGHYASSCHPVGTRRSCRRPRWPISCCTPTGRRRPATPRRAATSTPRSGGETRIGERLADSADSAFRPGRAWSRVRAVRGRHRVGGRAAVGVRQRRARRQPTGSPTAS